MIFGLDLKRLYLFLRTVHVKGWGETGVHSFNCCSGSKLSQEFVIAIKN